MTTENTPAAGAGAPAVPAATATNTTAAVTAAPTPPAAPSVPNVGEPDWLNGRIAQAKKSAEADVLKSLGVSNVDEAKAAIEAAKAKAESEKTLAEKAAELRTKLDGESAKAAEQAKIIAEYAGRQMVGLTPEQTAAVKAIAGDDPAKQLQTIAALQPTWSAASAKAATLSPGGATTTVAPDTAPGHTAPAGAGTSPPNHRSTYESARSANPFAAAQYGLQHEADVYTTKS